VVANKARDLLKSLEGGETNPARALLNRLDGVSARGTLVRDDQGQVVGNVEQPLPSPPPKPVSGGTAFQRGLLERVSGNVAALPSMLMAGSGLTSPNPAQGMLGVDVPSILPQLEVPKPSGREALAGVLGGVKGVGNLLQGEAPRFGEQVQASVAESERTQADSPLAFGSGGALGDALTILAGRAPLVHQAAAAPKVAQQAASATPGVKNAIRVALESKPVQKLARAAGRSLQTGVEGATLAMLQDGDPVEMGAYSSAGQLAGSASLGLITGLKGMGLTRAGLTVGAAAFAAGSLMQLGKSVTPGGKNFILESLESGYSKVALALALGAVSGLAGAGRISGKFANTLPVTMDAITTIPRGMVLSVLRDALSDPDVEKTVNIINTQPDAFAPRHMKAINKGLESGKSLSEIVKDLSRDKRFSDVLSAPDPRLAGVPVREDEE
jgi:hypothetical protein